MRRRRAPRPPLHALAAIRGTGTLPPRPARAARPSAAAYHTPDGPYYSSAGLVLGRGCPRAHGSRGCARPAPRPRDHPLSACAALGCRFRASNPARTTRAGTNAPGRTTMGLAPLASRPSAAQGAPDPPSARSPRQIRTWAHDMGTQGLPSPARPQSVLRPPTKGRHMTTTGPLGPGPHKGASAPNCCCRRRGEAVGAHCCWCAPPPRWPWGAAFPLCAHAARAQYCHLWGSLGSALRHARARGALRSAVSGTRGGCPGTIRDWCARHKRSVCARSWATRARAGHSFFHVSAVVLAGEDVW